MFPRVCVTWTRLDGRNAAAACPPPPPPAASQRPAAARETVELKFGHSFIEPKLCRPLCALCRVGRGVALRPASACGATSGGGARALFLHADRVSTLIRIVIRHTTNQCPSVYTRSSVASATRNKMICQRPLGAASPCMQRTSTKPPMRLAAARPCSSRRGPTTPGTRLWRIQLQPAPRLPILASWLFPRLALRHRFVLGSKFSVPSFALGV